MKPMTDDNQLQSSFASIHLLPGERFYRRMRCAGWTPAGIARRHTFAAATLALALVAAILAFTPQGRAMARNIIFLFTHTTSDTLPQVSQSTFPTDPTFIPDIAAVEAQASFDVLAPTWLPDVVTFKGAAYDAAHQTVMLSYYYSSTKYGSGLESNGITVTEQALGSSTACDICSLVGASANIEEVQIGNTTGQYIQGVWQAIGDKGEWGWVSDPWLQRLRWQADGVAIEVLYMGLPEEVTKADLIAIAESMK
jgi:hypothetical protein